MAWLEEFLVRRKLGQKGIEDLGAREVEAFLILEHELAEANRGPGTGLARGPAERGRNV